VQPRCSELKKVFKLQACPIWGGKQIKLNKMSYKVSILTKEGKPKKGITTNEFNTAYNYMEANKEEGKEMIFEHFGVKSLFYVFNGVLRLK